MIKKRLGMIVVILLVIASMLPSMSVSAAFDSSKAALLPLMSTAGNQYIYSDNPEMLWDGTTTNPGSWVNNFSGRSGAYSIEMDLTPNTLYDAYFYHINKTQSRNIRVGVYLYTASGSSTVTILNKKVLTSSTFTGSGDDALCASVETGYQTSTNYTTQSVTNNGIFIADDTIAPLKLINGHVMFKVSSSTKCRIVFLDATSTANPKTLGKALPMSSGVTGLFAGDVKYVSYNYNTVSSNGSHGFYLALAGSAMGYNPGEYVAGSNTINSNNLLQGNYGIVYNMVLSNCAGKTIRITPDWDSIWNSANGTWQVRESLAYCPGGSTSSWTYKRIHSVFEGRDNDPKSPNYNKKIAYTGTEPTYIDVPVPAGNNSYNFKFILPGSNFGNVYFEIR